ncbi:HAD family hydrolase [Kaistia dalseonensis]|uniref:phosphoglycolate phosphatase n=1 Tax=Kaistia dalseonensis TaxID=410840 RepID=A0ABU0H299_9HYPH|nr:HAD family hydrolase [Kaistia dalseonensis]MCX5493861.1 HAD family hydrolase [Kaistia dalseonensis]MDQ0436426.1 phosphoglycolate phosphatase [Kaistia dalseonensis]
MPLRAILFDKDGTFLDFARTWDTATADVIRLLAAGDEIIAARLASIIHFDDATQRLLPTSPFVGGSLEDIGPDWAAALGQAPGPVFDARLIDLYYEAALDAAVPIGDPSLVFAALKEAGYRLGVITNDSERGARAHCAKLGLTHWFDDIIGYDSGHGRKPEAGQILAFLDRFGIRPEEAALVGDTMHDVDAARAAGVTAISVATGYLTEEQLTPWADYVLSDIMALPALLEKLREP